MSNDEFYAYGKDRAGLEAVMRFHAVKRWHMIDTTRTQTLAEHSANVALLAYYLAATSPQMYFGPSQNVAALALIHDIPEVFTGDIPSHTKRHLAGLHALEKAVAPRLFTLQAPEPIELLIKLCDLADGIRFIRLHGVDVTAKHAREGLEAQLEVKKEQAKSWTANVYKYVVPQIMFYAYEHS
jgi:5'-deoxynucleotidase YfbR-like HD superfamily hydrolase